MDTLQFKLREDFIPLIQLLKFTGVAESGAMASEMVSAGEVTCNGQTELRKRYKVRAGDVVETEFARIEVI